MAVRYNSVRFSLMILLLCAEANDKKNGLEFRDFEIDNSNNILKFLLPSGHMKSK